MIDDTECMNNIVHNFISRVDGDDNDEEDSTTQGSSSQTIFSNQIQITVDQQITYQNIRTTTMLVMVMRMVKRQ